MIILKHLFTENEKCLLNQAINLQRRSILKDAYSPEYLKDVEDLEYLLEVSKNKLWD